MTAASSKALAFEKRRQDLTKVLGDYGRARGSGRWDPLRWPIDFAIVNGVRTPGILSVPVLEVPEKWDKITGPGLAGAVPVYRGPELVEFDLVMQLFDRADWDQFHVFAPILERPRIGRRPQALRILYPLLELVSPPVRAIHKVKWKLEGPDELGIWKYTVTCWEFRRLKATQAKPEGEKDGPKLDPWEIKAEMLRIQNDQLAGTIEQLTGGG